MHEKIHKQQHNTIIDLLNNLNYINNNFKYQEVYLCHGQALI